MPMTGLMWNSLPKKYLGAAHVLDCEQSLISFESLSRSRAQERGKPSLLVFSITAVAACGSELRKEGRPLEASSSSNSCFDTNRFASLASP